MKITNSKRLWNTRRYIFSLLLALVCIFFAQQVTHQYDQSIKGGSCAGYSDHFCYHYTEHGWPFSYQDDDYAGSLPKYKVIAANFIFYLVPSFLLVTLLGQLKHSKKKGLKALPEASGAVLSSISRVAETRHRSFTKSGWQKIIALTLLVLVILPIAISIITDSFLPWYTRQTKLAQVKQITGTEYQKLGKPFDTFGVPKSYYLGGLEYVNEPPTNPGRCSKVNISGLATSIKCVYGYRGNAKVDLEAINFQKQLQDLSNTLGQDHWIAQSTARPLTSDMLFDSFQKNQKQGSYNYTKETKTGTCNMNLTVGDLGNFNIYLEFYCLQNYAYFGAS